MFKKVVRAELERLVRKYFKKYNPKLIVIVGAVGKTTTKSAIAKVLRESGLNIRCAEGNYNSEMSVPLAILGVESPETGIKSIKTWLDVFAKMRAVIRHDNAPEIIVQELGTDHPGEIPHFGEYLKPDLAVVTSVAPEHMEYFKTLDAVAKEELSIFDFCDDILLCECNIDKKYLKGKKYQGYGLGGKDYSFEIAKESLVDGYDGAIKTPSEVIDAHINIYGRHILNSVTAAAAVANKLGVDSKRITKALATIKPEPGRMNFLHGVNGSILIDDTYNSSPSAAEAALEVLYSINAKQRIAVLGSMNELGETSEQAHRDLGKLCDPKKLDMVITIGAQANEFTLEAAEKRGNKVKAFVSSKEAGEYLKPKIKEGAVILLKGSQNGVFAEEATKVLLKDPKDAKKLVRQSDEWLRKKSV